MGSSLPPLNQPPPVHRTGATINQRPQLYARQLPMENNANSQSQQQSNPNQLAPNSAASANSKNASAPVTGAAGPIITVFVGNISERAPEPMIKKILATVGAVISWKRVSTFGFCEYE